MIMKWNVKDSSLWDNLGMSDILLFFLVSNELTTGGSVAQWARMAAKCAKIQFGEWKYFNLFCTHMKADILGNIIVKYLDLKMKFSILIIILKLKFR